MLFDRCVAVLKIYGLNSPKSLSESDSKQNLIFFTFLMSGFLVDHVKHVLVSGYLFLKTAELKSAIRWIGCIPMCEGQPFCIFVNIPTGFINVCYKSFQVGLQAQMNFLVSDLKWNVLVLHYMLLIRDYIFNKVINREAQFPGQRDVTPIQSFQIIEANLI